MEATEAADTRCWGLLPDKIQVLRLELPAGQHTINLQSLGATGYPLGHMATQQVTIINGRNTYMLANYPYYNVVGQILTNQQPAPPPASSQGTGESKQSARPATVR